MLSQERALDKRQFILWAVGAYVELLQVSLVARIRHLWYCTGDRPGGTLNVAFHFNVTDHTMPEVMHVTTNAVMEIARQAEALSANEQLYLIALLAGKMQRVYRSNGSGRRWREIRGAAPCPMVGEDTQAWVSRNRRKDDESREQRWKRTL